jgi:hypothetical protein
VPGVQKKGLQEIFAGWQQVLQGVLPLQAAPRLGLIAVKGGNRVGSECSALLRSGNWEVPKYGCSYRIR